MRPAHWNCRAAVGGLQLPHQTECTDSEYVNTEGWKEAPRPEKCPLADKCKGRIQGHGTYSRQTPDGMRVRRWRCAQCGGTVSMLPSCMAAHLQGSLEEVEKAVGAAQGEPRPAPEEVHPSAHIEPQGAARWLRRRVRRVVAGLQVAGTLLPDRFAGLPPTVEAFRGALGGKPALGRLRKAAAAQLQQLPCPIGFSCRSIAAPAQPGKTQHSSGLDPPGPAR